MNKKIFIIIVIILILGIIGVGGYLLIKNNLQPTEVEIQPAEEITDEQMRQTIVTLYYQNKETKELMPEGRTIDSKELLSDPYVTLMKLLIEGPKSENLQSAIPEGTRVIKAELKGDILYLDLSKEFIDNHEGGEEAENLTIYSIVNTVTELNEVNSVKILINGREDQSFNDNKINFRNAFVRVEKEDNTKNDVSNNTVNNATQNNENTNVVKNEQAIGN